mmetsp:Transcript_11092/g.13956  ORF Transcript_11092/g.13956 Transcript_11092/m.13956 type:complete len:302 (-) Transcript_11092:58-963(-)
MRTFNLFILSVSYTSSFLLEPSSRNLAIRSTHTRSGTSTNAPLNHHHHASTCPSFRKLSSLRLQMEPEKKSDAQDAQIIKSNQNNTKVDDTIQLFKNQLQHLVKRSKDILSNTFNSEFGSRGEMFVGVELLIFYCILIGNIPFLKELASFLLGPVLFMCGLSITGLAIREMNTSFTAYINPVATQKGGMLVDKGVYSYVRHPVYAGNLCCFVGLSIITGSSMRLFLTGLYYILVDIKAQKEEDEMLIVFGSKYTKYKQDVQGKFVPTKWVKVISNVFEKVKLSKNKKSDGTNGSKGSRLFP